MRRAVFALLGTTIGTSLLIGAKLGHPTQEDGRVTVDTAGAAAADIPSGEPGAAGAPASGAPAPRATKTTAAAPQPKPPAPTGLKSGTYPGAGYRHQYGTVTVTITVSGGVVTNANATYPSSGQSGEINGAAVPKLNSEAVAAKTSASLSTVSGATLTSNAYRLSLQSALDKAKA